MVENTEIRYKSVDQKTSIFATRWVPLRERQRGILLIVHGGAEHIARYDEFATHLAQFGIKVLGCDLPGHGRAVRQTETPGHLGDQEGWRLAVEDLYSLCAMQRKNNPSLPIFLMGHGMGGVMVQELLMEHGDYFSGAILCGIGDRGGFRASLGLLAVTLERIVKKDDAPSRLAEGIYTFGYARSVSRRRTSLDWLCSDPEVVDAYRESDLCGFPLSVASYRAMFIALKRARDTKQLRRIPETMPVLFISGRDDPAGGYGKGVQAVAERFKAAGIKKVGVRLYKGMRHEILNEVGRGQVYTEILRWLTYLMDAEESEQDGPM